MGWDSANHRAGSEGLACLGGSRHSHALFTAWVVIPPGRERDQGTTTRVDAAFGTFRDGGSIPPGSTSSTESPPSSDGGFSHGLHGLHGLHVASRSVTWAPPCNSVPMPRCPDARIRTAWTPSPPSQRRVRCSAVPTRAMSAIRAGHHPASASHHPASRTSRNPPCTRIAAPNPRGSGSRRVARITPVTR